MRTHEVKCQRLIVEEIINHAGATPAIGDQSASELGVLDGITAGTITASKAVVVDANKDAGDFRNLDAVNIDAGASGTAGSVDVFPTTAAKGKLILAAVDNDGDTNVTISNAAMGQASVISIPDPGAATAEFLLTDQDNDGVPVTATSAELNTLDGATVTTAQLNSLRRNPGSMASAYIDFNATGEAAMTVTIDGIVYQEADTADAPNGVWTNGASAADSATSLIAAINGDTRAAVPFTAVADATGDGVWLFWDAVGTAGNVTIATSSASNCTVQNSTGGAAAAIKQTCTIVHTVNTQELLSGVIEIPIPFTPTHVHATAVDASGTPIYFTDTVTIATSPDRIKITTAGATNLADTNVVHLTATE